MNEEVLKRASNILRIIGWICFFATLLIEIEFAFVASSALLIVKILELGGDPTRFFMLIRITGFFLQFAFIMFIFSLILLGLGNIMKKRKTIYEGERKRFFDEVKSEVLQTISEAQAIKSRRKKQ